MNLLQLVLATQQGMCITNRDVCSCRPLVFPPAGIARAQQVHGRPQVLCPLSCGWMCPSLTSFSHCKQHCNVHSDIHLLELTGKVSRVSTLGAKSGLGGMDILTFTKLFCKDNDHQSILFPCCYDSLFTVFCGRDSINVFVYICSIYCTRCIVSRG